MKRPTELVIILASLLGSLAFAEAPQPAADTRQQVGGAHFIATSPTGESNEEWISSADGSLLVKRSSGVGKKAGAVSTAPGHWSVNDSGHYCLRVEWDVHQGGPEDWCAPVAVGDDGAITLALADGRKVSVNR